MIPDISLKTIMTLIMQRMFFHEFPILFFSVSNSTIIPFNKTIKLLIKLSSNARRMQSAWSF